MKRAKPSGAKLASGILGGGVMAGLLLSMAVPTTMKRQGHGWRDLIPAASAAVDEDSSTFWVEAPPQDLTPASWQPDDSWTEPQWDDEGYASYGYEPNYGEESIFEADLAVRTTTPQLAYEPVQVSMTRQNADHDPTGVHARDAAAASAEAARMAAADVRMEITAAAQEARETTQGPDDFQTAFAPHSSFTTLSQEP